MYLDWWKRIRCEIESKWEVQRSPIRIEFGSELPHPKESEWFLYEAKYSNNKEDSLFEIVSTYYLLLEKSIDYKTEDLMNEVEMN